MPENIKNREFRDYLNDIIEVIDDIQNFTENISFRDLENDKKTLYAVIRCLEILGEAVKKIPKNVKERYPDIPWKDMAGMRDVLIHDYFGVDVETVWLTVNEKTPHIKPIVEKMLKELNDEKT
ncbi:MAG: HepT-like ribonuclease domain-containing protein [Candidatus Scalindua sp.]